MARPTKDRLEYFSFDVDFFDDEKIMAVSGEFGIKGEIIAIRLLCAIYRNGYFIEWSDLVKNKVAKQSGIAPGLVGDVVNRLVKYHFFSAEMFEQHSVLTSSGIQSRWLSATRKRKDKEELEFWLIRKKPPQIYVSSGRNHTKTEFLPPETPQSKVKESKVKENPPNPPSEIPSFSNKLEEFEHICMSDQSWHEQMAMGLRGVTSAKIIRSTDDVKEWVGKFFLEMRGRDELKVNLRETKGHCFSWIKKELEKLERQGSWGQKPAEGASDKIRQKYFQNRPK